MEQHLSSTYSAHLNEQFSTASTTTIVPTTTATNLCGSSPTRLSPISLITPSITQKSTSQQNQQLASLLKKSLLSAEADFLKQFFEYILKFHAKKSVDNELLDTFIQLLLNNTESNSTLLTTIDREKSLSSPQISLQIIKPLNIPNFNFDMAEYSGTLVRNFWFCMHLFYYKIVNCFIAVLIILLLLVLYIIIFILTNHFCVALFII